MPLYSGCDKVCAAGGAPLQWRTRATSRPSVRVLEVSTVTKNAAGASLITGADVAPMGNPNRIADYRREVGTFAITRGQIQLNGKGEDPTGFCATSFLG